MLAKGIGVCNRVWAYFKQGWNDVPFLYAGFAIGFAGISVGIVRILHWPTGGYITRYKERYLVMRPDDERLVGYPKEYVTDNHLLK